jgi:hypothetical protein
MTIVVHEWPIPACDKEAIAVVFELGCPITLDMWRSTTFHVLVDVCTPQEEILHTNAFITLPDYPALQHYHQCHSRQRLTLALNAKPFSLEFNSALIGPGENKLF